MRATPNRAWAAERPKPDSLRSPAGAIWPALPERDRHLLLWLLSADIVTASLAELLVYRSLRSAQRRLARLSELGVLRGFWAAGRHRPRGRHAYVLTRQARADIERIVWPTGRPGRARDMPQSAAIHQLATHDIFAAFLQSGDPLLDEGIFAWISERACGQIFDGFLRPDALAGLRVGGRAIALFIERDLGTERGEVIGEKIRRYRSTFARGPELPILVGFIVESDRRAQAIHRLIVGGRARESRLVILTAVDRQVRANPLGAWWTDGHERWATRELPPLTDGLPLPILTPGCLAEADALAALDDRALELLPPLHAYLR
jgi:Replication-relaxation